MRKTRPFLTAIFWGQLACGSLGALIGASAQSAALPGQGSPSFAISDVFVDEGDDGITDALFQITLAPAASQAAQVTYVTFDDTAEAGVDYLFGSGVVTFLPGETSKSIRVAVLGNRSAQPNRQFSVELSLPENGIIIKPKGAGWILDDDGSDREQEADLHPLPVIAVTDAFGIEEPLSEQSRLQFVVRLSEAHPDPVIVAYNTIDGQAVSRVDYSPASGQLTFEPGETNKVVSVEILADGLSEAEERMILRLSTPVNAVIGDGEGTGTIADDDPALFSIQDAAVLEGDTASGQAIFSVTLANAVASPVTVAYTTVEGSARAGVDYAATQGLLTFPPGDGPQTQNITVGVIGNRLWQTDRLFFVELAVPEHAAAARGRAEGSILDDDSPPAVSVTSAPVPEGSGDTSRVPFTVSLSEAAGRPVAVDYTTADALDPHLSAIAGTDYVPVQGTLTFNPGETAKSIQVPVIGDSIPEFDETFWLALTSEDAVVTPNSSALGVIRNDDFPPEPPTISAIASPTIREDSPAEPILFTVEDPDQAGAALLVTATSSNSDLVPDASLEFGRSGSEHFLFATPAPNQSGETLITVVVSDADSLTATNRFTLTVLPVNDAPSFVKGPDQTVADTAGRQVIHGWAKELSSGPPDEAGQTLSFQVSVDTPGLFASPPAIELDGTLTFAPAFNKKGTAAVSVVLADDGGRASGGVDMSEPQSFTITVKHTNQAPTISTIPDQAIDQDTAMAAVPLSIDDLETAIGELRIEATSSNSSLVPGNTATNILLGWSGTNRTISLFPSNGQTGTSTITLRVTDDGTPPLSATASFDLTVVPVTNAPPPTPCPSIITLSSPAGQTCFNASSPVHLAAFIGEGLDQVARVEFYLGDALVSTDFEAPFEFAWDEAPIGDHCLTAKAVCQSSSTASSEPFCFTVSEAGPAVGIIRNFDDPEIDALRQYLLELGYCTRVLDQAGLEEQDLSSVDLLIWDDLGADGLTDTTVQVLSQFLDSGKSIFLIGDRLLSSAANLSPAFQDTWLQLARLTPVKEPGVPGQVTFWTTSEFREPGSVLNGAFGEVVDFQYTNRVDIAIAAPDAAALGFSLADSSALLVQYPGADGADTGLGRSVSQDYRMLTGGDPESVLVRKTAFQNAVLWLQQRPYCPFVYLSLQASDDVPAVVNVGDEFTFTMAVGNNGECFATGTVVTNRFPAGLELVEATFDRGISAGYDPLSRTLTWRIGAVASGTINNAILTLTVRAIQPGLFHNVAVATADHEQLSESNVAEFDVRVEGAAPETASLSMSRRNNGQFACVLSGVPGTTYMIQQSGDLLTWESVATVVLTDEGAGEYEDTTGTDPAQRFYRAVRLP